MAEEIVVLITVSSSEEAATIGRTLVEEHLAACVNILPDARSLFFWEGRVQDERESLMMVKSRKPLLGQLTTRVKQLHSYSVPEIIAIPIIGGSADYLAWLNDMTKG